MASKPSAEMTTEEREHEWAAMTRAERATALHNVAWGYETVLTVDELRGIVLGEYGGHISARFIETLQRGVFTQSGVLRSFAANCVNFGRFDILEMMATLPAPVLVNGNPCGPAEWLDMLCMRVTADGTTVHHTLYQQAAQKGAFGPVRELLAFAHKHQPNHPHVEMLVEGGGPAGAVMAELVMAKRMRAGEKGLVGQNEPASGGVRRRSSRV